MISFHVLEGQGIGVRWFGRSWATAGSLQDLLQGACYGQILGGKADGEAHSSLAITANSHQCNMGSGCMFVWMYRAAFLALEKVFPHTKEFTASLDIIGKGKVKEAPCRRGTDVLKFVQQDCNRTRNCNNNSYTFYLPFNRQAVLCLSVCYD